MMTIGGVLSLWPDWALLIAALLFVLVAALPVALLVELRLQQRRHRCLCGKPWKLPALEPVTAAVEPSAQAAEEEETAGLCGEDKRRRRRAKSKQQQQQQQQMGGGDGDAALGGWDEALPRRPRFPVASVAGSLQRRITARYDDLARASQGHTLTIDQVHEFINCLVDARNELLQKSENARRSFTIKKAMLSNTCNRRSAHDRLRLCEQVDKLKYEHERLIKDAAVYSYVQEQLQLSEPYKLIMEHGAREHELPTEEPEMSFEELLAQEKEDAAFWWRDGKLRSISGK